MIDKLKSRKLWITVLCAVLAVLGEELGFSQITQWVIALLGGTYVVGQGIADHGKQGEAQAADSAIRAEAHRVAREIVAAEAWSRPIEAQPVHHRPATPFEYDEGADNRPSTTGNGQRAEIPDSRG